MQLCQFTNGRIYPTPSSAPVSQLWCRDGLVIDSSQAQELADSGAAIDVIDLGGATVLPAFRDGHAHPLFAAREAMGLHLTDCRDLESIQAAIAAYRLVNPDIGWIDGAIYERGITAGREPVAARLLDAVVSDIPVVLHADDHHTLWVNTAALVAAGLGSAGGVAQAAARIQHGSIDVDAAGAATGILREWEAMSLVLDRAPKPTLPQDLNALDDAQRLLLANGLAAVVDAWIDPGMAEVYMALAESGRLRIRIDLAFRFAPGEWRERLAYFVEMRDRITAAGNTLLTANTAKFFADGAFGSATAYVHEPYVGTTGHAGKNGQAVWSAAEFAEATRAAAASGFALHIHAIGDAGVSAALDAIESVPTELRANRPAVIAHVELVRPSDWSRFAELGVVANFEPYWAQQNAMLTSCVPHLGTERVDAMYAMRTALESAVAVSFGSDWPVSSFVPLEGIQVAATRATLEAPGNLWTPEQTLSIQEAVHAYTAAVAAQMGDSEAGSLLPGMRADLVVLATDPLAGAKEGIAKCKVLATYVGGQELYSA